MEQTTGRELIKQQAAENHTYLGPVGGASLAALAEWWAWDWLRVLLPIDTLHPALIGLLLLSIAAVGAGAGAAVEYFWRRAFVAPRRVIDLLAERIAGFDQGPMFYIMPTDPLTVTNFLDPKTKQPAGLMVLIQLRVTNEGKRGAALDWIAWIEFGAGETVPLERVESRDHRIGGSARGLIKRTELIWERTATAIETDDTRYGYFIGTAPIDLQRRLDQDGDWELGIACRDHRGRPTGVAVSLWNEPGQHIEVRALAEPTLSRVRFERLATGSEGGDEEDV